MSFRGGKKVQKQTLGKACQKLGWTVTDADGQNVFASQWFQKHCSWYIAWYKYDYDSGSGKCDRVLVMFWSLTQICSKYGIRVSRSQRMRTESDVDFESDPLVENV